MKMNWKFNIFVALVVLFFIELHYIDGARGGSRAGTRSSRSYRSRSSSSSSSKIRTYSGPKYKAGSWKTAAAVGVVFGLMSYKTRRMYYSHPDREPRICYNEKNLRNGTYGYFICPEFGQKDDYAYCCGSSDSQKCCTYTDKSAEGRIAGIVVGVVLACVVIGVVVYCVVVKKKCRKKEGKGGVILNNDKQTAGGGGAYIPTEQQPLNPAYNNVGGQQFPMQSYNPQPGFGASQPYDPNTQGLPYSTNPGVPGVTAYPPPEGAGAYPQNPTPYPPPQDHKDPGGPPPIGFTGTEPYPGAGGFVPPPGQEPYPQPPPGSYPGGFAPPTGNAPTAPPPSYGDTQYKP